MPIRHVIIADDLTGALDSAAAWGAHARVSVLLNPAALNAASADVIALDTNTRYRPAEIAAEIVTESMARALRLGSPIYKKIDSMLRGNTATEIASALQVFARQQASNTVALIAPAFPDAGRTVIDGVVRVENKPFANGNLCKCLMGANLRVALVDLDTVRKGTTAIKAACVAHIADRVEAIVVDAETNADLESIDNTIDALGSRVLPIGSGGLIRLAAHRDASDDAVLDSINSSADSHTMIVIGSYSDRARAQRARLQEARVPLVPLHAPFGDEQQQKAARALSRNLADGDALLCPDPSTRVDKSQAETVAMALAVTVGRILTMAALREKLTGLILTGGETARAVLLAAGVDQLTVHGEIEPGVVRSSADRLNGITIVTKAGDFGDAQTLERARRALMSRAHTGSSADDATSTGFLSGTRAPDL